MIVTASPYSFSKKIGAIMPLDQNVHQTVTRLGCVGFLMYACKFSMPQMWQFCLLTYPPRLKWASSEKMIFFLPKSASSVSRSQAYFPSVVQAYTQPYSFDGRIKLIICQIRRELSATIYEISTSWKKTVDGGPYISYENNFFFFFWILILILIIGKPLAMNRFL